MGLLDLFGKSNKKFIEENAVSADKKHLLQTGAILVYANSACGWMPQTLLLDQKKLTAEQILSRFWDAENKEEVLQLIDGLIVIGGFGFAGGDHAESRSQIDARLEGYTAGDQSALSDEEAEMLDEVVDLITGYKMEKTKLTATDISSVTTTLAWDIERAAFLTRLAFNSGLLTEEETWAFLKKTRELAQAGFRNWQDYGISFIKGRAIVMCDSDFSDMSDMWSNVALLADPKWGEVWTWATLK